MIVGLTGGIASGKSTVARMLAAKGAAVFDADEIAREAVEPGRPAWREIVDWLGEEILLPGGGIDRPRLAKLVFSDAAAREKLNAIVHPRVGQELLERTQACFKVDPHRIAVYDVPLLIETGMHRMVDEVVLVYVCRRVQLERLRLRDNLSAAAALARLKAQMPLDEKRKFADYIIDNSGTPAETARQVDCLWVQLSRSAAGGDGPV